MNVINALNFFQKSFTFNDFLKLEKKFLYAGDVPKMKEYDNYIGLSIKWGNKNHIKHNVLKPYPIPDNCVDRYQAEDVFEHIPYDNLPFVLNEIHRILKPNAFFRLSMPDYCCDFVAERTLKDTNGQFIFDPVGGGKFKNGMVINGGHAWFPLYQSVKMLIERSSFKNHYSFYHYYDESGNPITNQIDYKQGMVRRTPDFDHRVKNPYRPLSIVVDCFKQ